MNWKPFLVAGLLVTGGWSIPAQAEGDQTQYLQSLVPTSGESASVLLDGDPESSWSPTGDPSGEGVLFRFEKPVRVDLVRVELCEGSGVFKLVPYINGSSYSAKPVGSKNEAFEVPIDSPKLKMRSLFLRIATTEGVPCLAEVVFSRDGQTLKVEPPRAVTGSVEASSTLKPADAYHVAYLFDGRTDFGWVEGAKGLGKGESVTLELDKPLRLVSLELWNGYQRSKDHFRKNARATRLSLKVGDGEPISLKVKDKMGPQTLRLPEPVEGQRFELTVLAARKGKRYPDLVLSELRLWDASGPLTVTTTDMEERRDALIQQVDETPLNDVIDRQWTCRCGDRRLTRLKLRSNHTFVWYLDAEVEGEEETRSQSEVFDGAWVVAKPQEPSAVISLYGRRHKTSSVYNPYAGNRVRDTVRIGGGKVRITRLSDVEMEAFVKLARQWRSGPARDRVECLDLSDEGAGVTFETLKKKGAILLQGKAMTDLMIHEGR